MQLSPGVRGAISPGVWDAVISRGMGYNISRGTGCNISRGMGCNIPRGTGCNIAGSMGCNISRVMGCNYFQGYRVQYLRGMGFNYLQGSGVQYLQGHGMQLSPGVQGAISPGVRFVGVPGNMNRRKMVATHGNVSTETRPCLWTETKPPTPPGSTMKIEIGTEIAQSKPPPHPPYFISPQGHGHPGALFTAQFVSPGEALFLLKLVPSIRQAPGIEVVLLGQGPAVPWYPEGHL